MIYITKRKLSVISIVPRREGFPSPTLGWYPALANDGRHHDTDFYPIPNSNPDPSANVHANHTHAWVGGLWGCCVVVRENTLGRCG